MVQDAYYFLCLNYRPGDELHFVGFSRGAFTVRALACLIEGQTKVQRKLEAFANYSFQSVDVGILGKTRLALLPMIYSLWKNQEIDKLKEHVEGWGKKGHINRDIIITSCGVWDTVSAIIPAKELSFVSARVPRILRYAFQGLALHEMRTSFPPILWNTDLGKYTTVKQCWLAGDHSDVGGGHPDAGLATVSLLWMVSQYREYTEVSFEEVMLLDCMTPVYLHWQEQALFHWDEGSVSFFNKQEFALQNHTYTKG
jgi:uncharacterized protein (DUF2235 family)